jgi:hypothetical protein
MSAVAGPPLATGYAGVLRKAVADLLAALDAWYEADPDGRFTATLDALARAYVHSEHVAQPRVLSFPPLRATL